MAGRLLRLGALLRDMTAPSTPASGYLAVYANSDRPYAKDDGGNVMRMDNSVALAYTKMDVLATGTGAVPLPAPFAGVIERVDLAVQSAPTGAAIIVDVNKGGTTIFTTQSNRPQIAASATTGNSTAIEAGTVAAGDKLTVDIDQVGSTLPGTTLVVVVTIRRTG